MNFCPGELILKLLARIGEWPQNLNEKTGDVNPSGNDKQERVVHFTVDEKCDGNKFTEKISESNGWDLFGGGVLHVQ